MNARHLAIRSIAQLRTRQTLSLAACVVAAALYSNQAHSEALRVAVVDIAPYAMSEANGRAFGQYPDLVRLIAARAEIDTDIKVVSCTRAAEMLESGQIDLVVALDAAPLRRVARPLATIANLDTVVVARNGQFDDSSNAKPNFSLGRVRGGCMGSAASTDAGYKDVEVDSLHDGVRALAAKRLDGLALTREAFFHYANLNNLEPKQFGAMVPTGRQLVWLYAANKLPFATTQAIWQSIDGLKKEKDAQTTAAAAKAKFLRLAKNP